LFSMRNSRLNIILARMATWNFKDDSRKHELAERNKRDYGVKYRYWKSEEATLEG
jgi:hypothetical protein